MWMDTIDREQLLRVVGPALDHGGADEIAREVRARWTPEQLCPMLHDEDAGMRKIACVLLGLTGDRGAIHCLARALRDGEPVVGQLAEHAMWSIWFRAGSPEAQRQFQRGVRAIDEGRFDEAAERLTLARRIDPQFVEAYNQSAIARYMLEDYEGSIDEALLCVDIEPLHFGALAGLGHCYAQLGDLSTAAMYYRRAIAANPRLEAIAGALHRIAAAVAPGRA
jgi:tetratricopeptide (TPR) repeat protein